MFELLYFILRLYFMEVDMENFRAPYGYNPDDFPGEVNSGEIVVEDEGFASTEEMVTEMLVAGERLMQWRQEHYDYSEDQDDDDGYVSLERKQNVDRTDVDRYIKELNHLQEERKERYKKKNPLPQTDTKDEKTDGKLFSDNGHNPEGV